MKELYFWGEGGVQILKFSATDYTNYVLHNVCLLKMCVTWLGGVVMISTHPHPQLLDDFGVTNYQAHTNFESDRTNAYKILTKELI